MNRVLFHLLVCGLLISHRTHAFENVPNAPFAQFANVPDPGQLTVRFLYEQSEAYNIWAYNPAGQKEMSSVKWWSGGEQYGIDVLQGWVTLQYGITEKWAADLSVGYASSSWRYFSNYGPPGGVEATTGIMDVGFGVRYQIWKEGEDENAKWKPTLTFRAGAVMPGTFDQYFPYAPGTRSAAVEPELLARKHFGWPGLGAYFDGLYRWNMTSGNGQYIVCVGFFQEIKGWELDVGYRHLGTVHGDNVVFDPTTYYVTYPRAVRENLDSIQAGFSYTTSKKKWTWGFLTQYNLDGNNSQQQFWLGGYLEIPFQIVKPKEGR